MKNFTDEQIAQTTQGFGISQVISLTKEIELLNAQLEQEREDHAVTAAALDQQQKRSSRLCEVNNTLVDVLRIITRK